MKMSLWRPSDLLVQYSCISTVLIHRGATGGRVGGIGVVAYPQRVLMDALIDALIDTLMGGHPVDSLDLPYTAQKRAPAARARHRWHAPFHHEDVTYTGVNHAVRPRVSWQIPFRTCSCLGSRLVESRV